MDELERYIKVWEWSSDCIFAATAIIFYLCVDKIFNLHQLINGNSIGYLIFLFIIFLIVTAVLKRQYHQSIKINKELKQ